MFKCCKIEVLEFDNDKAKLCLKDSKVKNLYEDTQNLQDARVKLYDILYDNLRYEYEGVYFEFRQAYEWVIHWNSVMSKIKFFILI